MSQLTELVFENVADSLVNEIIQDIVAGEEILNVILHGVGQEELNDESRDWAWALKNSIEPSAIIFLKISSVSIRGIRIKNPLIRLQRFEECNDVSVIFESEDVLLESSDSHESIVKRLAAAAADIASTAGVQYYYCGYEPATDPDTRLFTREVLGPLDSL
jgi:hypothetical protein